MSDSAIEEYYIKIIYQINYELRGKMTEKQQFVEFQIDEKSYGIDIDLVKEILMSWTIIPVSTFMNEVSGVIFLRGDDIPVINIRRLLNITETEEENPARSIIIVGTKDALGRSYGLMVDSVCNIFEVEEKINNLNESNIGTGFPYIIKSISGKILSAEDLNKTECENQPSSILWLDSDKLIQYAMKESTILDPKIPYNGGGL